MTTRPPPPQLAESELPATCRHGSGKPRDCSQCRAAPARRITRVDGVYAIDGVPIVREAQDPISEKAAEYARRGGRAHARVTNG